MLTTPNHLPVTRSWNLGSTWDNGDLCWTGTFITESPDKSHGFSWTLLSKGSCIRHIPALFLDYVVQRVLHKSRSVWHSVYIPKDSQPKQVQAYYQKQDTGGSGACLWGERGKWHNPLWRTEVEISPPLMSTPRSLLTTDQIRYETIMSHCRICV